MGEDKPLKKVFLVSGGVAVILFVVLKLVPALKPYWFISKESQTERTTQKQDVLENKLAFNGSDGRPKIFDFKDKLEHDLGISGYAYPFLWSPDGRNLAMLVQGEYGGDAGFSLIPEVKATTAGFNYLLYVVDLETYQTKLLVDEIFGDVFWSKDFSGLYFNEKYQNSNPILIGNQSLPLPDRIEYFYIGFEGVRKGVEKRGFYLNSVILDPTRRYSPDRGYFITGVDVGSGFSEKIVSTSQAKEFLMQMKFKNYYLKDSLWSPSGEKIAFVYKPGQAFDTDANFQLAVVSLNELLSGEVLAPQYLPVLAQNLYFSWINEKNILVSQIGGLTKESGKTGIYNLDVGRLEQLTPDYLPELAGITDFTISPDKHFFTYQDKGEIVASSLTKDQTVRLNGDLPFWFDPPEIFGQSVREELESVLPVGTFLRDFKEVGQSKYLTIYSEPDYRIGDENYENLSCPTMILGQAIIGDYHVALVEDGNIISDVEIPTLANFESDDMLALVYINRDYEDYENYENDNLRVVNLIDLKDYTGDGKANEFILTTTSGGCGFYENIVAGYDDSADAVKLYSDWIMRFDPVAGKAYDLIDCGNHGSDVRIEKWWEFNENKGKFELVDEKITECTEEFINEIQAVSLVEARPEVQKWLENFPGPGRLRSDGESKAVINVDHKDGEVFVIHVYELLSDHRATFNWYNVNIKTKLVTPLF